MLDKFSYPVFFACGLGLYVTMYLWRKGAARWSTWFPVLRKTLEWGLIGIAAALAVFSLYGVANAELPASISSMVLAAGAVVPELYQRFKKKPHADKDETQRGSEVLSATEIRKRVKQSKEPTHLSVGEVPVPVSAEPYHFLIAGSTGTGKSVAINALLTKIRERGDTAILVDSGGDFLSKHFQKGTDFVFNPFDDRCVGWSPTLEMQGAWDAQALARSIVPDGIGDNREWNSYAQTFIGSVLRKLWETQRLTLADFLYFAQVAPVKELKELLEGTPAMSQLGSEKMFGSIRTIASNYLTSYDYLPTDQEPFSLTQMVQAEHSGVLFVTYRDDQLDALRNIIASMLDVAARAILSLEPNPNRRVWLIIDEFASIGRVQSVEAVATKARKAGGCLVLGVQSVSQLRDRYGDNGAQTILSCLSTWLVLRCSDADTAEYMSRYIGEAEISRVQSGKTSGDTGDSQSQNEQRLTRRTVLASEIQQFENLNGMLKLAGNHPVCQVKLPVTKLAPTGNKAFEARDFIARPLLRMQARGAAAPRESEASAPAFVPAATVSSGPPVAARPVSTPVSAPVQTPAFVPAAPRMAVAPSPVERPAVSMPPVSAPVQPRPPTAAPVSPAPVRSLPAAPSLVSKPPLLQAPTLPLAQRVALATQAHTLVQALRAQGVTAAPVPQAANGAAAPATPATPAIPRAPVQPRPSAAAPTRPPLLPGLVPPSALVRKPGPVASPAPLRPSAEAARTTPPPQAQPVEAKPQNVAVAPVAPAARATAPAPVVSDPAAPRKDKGTPEVATPVSPEKAPQASTNAPPPRSQAPSPKQAARERRQEPRAVQEAAASAQVETPDTASQGRRRRRSAFGGESLEGLLR